MTRTAVAPSLSGVARRTARLHGVEILIEAMLIGLFMVSACGFGTLLEVPASPVRQAIPDPFVRRVIMGMAMGLTAVTLIYSPLGRRSGAHMNPAVTLTFLRLRRLPVWDALLYLPAQLVGAALGVAVMVRLLGRPLADAPVLYVQTLPGPVGLGWAFAAEVAISLVMMTVILEATSRRRLMRWTGVAAGMLVATWITFESPISGMSMNPARSFGSAAAAGHWEYLWLYATAPLLGMLLAGEIHHRRARHPELGDPPACAKLHHPMDRPCVFCAARARSATPA